MICLKCLGEGKKSMVYPGSVMKTRTGFTHFFDEEGRLHAHDPNKQTSELTCSNGHKWVQVDYYICWCGWTGRKN